MKTRTCKVLIVEDEPMLQSAYSYVLRHQGYRVAMAVDGNEAIELLKPFKPDIILLDILMPRLDGREFLEQSNVKDLLPNVKILACSNLSDQKTTAFMLEHGADEVVLKSDLSPSQLVKLIESYCN